MRVAALGSSPRAQQAPPPTPTKPMEALSALAVVAQKEIPPAGQEAIEKALLQADLKRTRLARERAAMWGEDQAARFVRTGRLLDTACDQLDALEVNFEEQADELSTCEKDLEEREQIIRKLQRENERLRDERIRNEQAERLVHTVPDDTEMDARRKFLKLWF